MVGEDSSVNIDEVEVTSDIEDNVEVGFLPPPHLKIAQVSLNLGQSCDRPYFVKISALRHTVKKENSIAN